MKPNAGYVLIVTRGNPIYMQTWKGYAKERYRIQMEKSTTHTRTGKLPPKLTRHNLHGCPGSPTLRLTA